MYNVVEHEAEARQAHGQMIREAGVCSSILPASCGFRRLYSKGRSSQIENKPGLKFQNGNSSSSLKPKEYAGSGEVWTPCREVSAPGLGRGNLSHCVSAWWGRKVEMDSKDDAGGCLVFSLSSESAVKHASCPGLPLGLHIGPSQTALDRS